VLTFNISFMWKLTMIMHLEIIVISWSKRNHYLFITCTWLVTIPYRLTRILFSWEKIREFLSFQRPHKATTIRRDQLVRILSNNLVSRFHSIQACSSRLNFFSLIILQFSFLQKKSGFDILLLKKTFYYFF